jgi:DNA-binding LacI/PurR family transcriptional regulator
VAAAGLRVPHDLTVVLVGSLPDELGIRHLPRIDLPVAEMSTAVARLAIDAIGSGRDDRPPSSQEPVEAPASDVPSDAPHHLIQPRMAGPVVSPPSPG